MVENSTIISIVYFGANILLLILLGIYVKEKCEHETIKSRAFIKDIWSQRKIYAPLIVHFYDTATDIGVVYYWYGLMKNEQKHGNDYYQSVDMTVFFWCGITFLLVYRFITLGAVVLSFCCKNADLFDLKSHWYDILLVLLDVYIFKAVYESIQEAQDTISDNIRARQQKKSQKQCKQIELQIKSGNVVEKDNNETVESDKDTTDATVKNTETITEKEIELHAIQSIMQFGESVTESMPQIMLQSVFVIRSANEPKLRDTDIVLILLSIIASLISISNKFLWIDEEYFNKGAQKLKPQFKFPVCIQYWYIIRAVWRICDVMVKFVIYVLMWSVLGGVWLSIWVCVVFVEWSIFLCVEENTCTIWGVGNGFINLAGLLIYDNTDMRHVVKYFENFIGLILIAVFATVKFNCGICADATKRQFVDNQMDPDQENNDRILIFFVMGSVVALMEPILYVFIRVFGMIKMK
eukprot:109410_1